MADSDKNSVTPELMDGPDVGPDTGSVQDILSLQEPTDSKAHANAHSSAKKIMSSKPHTTRSSRPIWEMRTKLTTLSASPASFKYEMLELFATNHIAAALALPLFATVLGSGVLLWMDWPYVAFWLAAIFVLQGNMVGQCERFGKIEPKEVDVARWGQRFTLAEFASGCAWAALPAFAWQSDNVVSHVVIFAITLSMIAVRVTLASQALAIVYAGTLPLAAVLIFRLIAEADMFHSVLAIIAVTAEFYFVWLARRLNTSNLQLIMLRAQKDGLIADLEQAKTRAEEARHRAEAANLAKSRFLATMSHELRTPLNAILGFSDIMRTELFGAHAVANYKDYSADIHQSGEHLLNLISEILDLSRIEAGRYKLDEKSVSLGDIGENCQKLLQIRARERDIDLRSSLTEAVPNVWADERAIRQIWLNLISNAVKFTPPGGVVLLEVTPSVDGGLDFSVTDTGPGIPEEEISLILSSFGQGTLARNHEEQGAGLGLPIVKGLAELHGGTLEVISVLRQGTKMVVHFPATRLLGPLPERVERSSTNSSADQNAASQIADSA